MHADPHRRGNRVNHGFTRDKSNAEQKCGSNQRPQFVNRGKQHGDAESRKQIVVEFRKQPVPGFFADAHVFFHKRHHHGNARHGKQHAENIGERSGNGAKIKNRNGMKDIGKARVRAAREVIA